LPIIEIQPVSKSASQNIAASHQHRVGVYFKRSGSALERMETPGTVQAQNACPVGADHPFVSDRDNSGDPVVLQVGGRGGVVRRNIAFVEDRDAAERAGNQFIARDAECVDVVIHQAVKRIHAVRAGRVEECKPRRSRESETIAVSGYVSNMVGDESVSVRQQLLLSACIVEANQSVGGGDVDRAGLRVRKNAIDALLGLGRRPSICTGITPWSSEPT
jgi:hypothetical protein